MNAFNNVPWIQEKTQQKVATLIKKSYEARKKAQSLLEKAKTTVEQQIEKEGRKG